MPYCIIVPSGGGQFRMILEAPLIMSAIEVCPTQMMRGLDFVRHKAQWAPTLDKLCRYPGGDGRISTNAFH